MTDGETELTEIEQKFDVPAGFVLPGLTGPGVAGVSPAKIGRASCRERV